MIRRFQEVFWPPKWKAAVAAICCFALAILLFSTSVLAVEGVAALIYGLWYALVWLVKFSRDQQLAVEAKAAAQARLQQAQQIAPVRTNPESSQLFVPFQFPDER